MNDPAAFRRYIQIDAISGAAFGELVQSWQQHDFKALDPAWKLMAGYEPRTKREVEAASIAKRRAWIERPRGHAKTCDMAVQIAWVLLFSRRSLRGVCAAADREQAGLIADAIRRLVHANPGICDSLRFRQNAIENDRTGSRLDLISSDIGSSFGLTPDFIICDELCHWPSEGLWHSLASAAAKKPHCLLAVLTNAGVGRGWQWQLREAARTHPDWHFSTIDGSQAPWIRQSDLDEQRAILPPSVFDRLWNNRWQTSAGNYLSIAEVATCRDERLSEQQRGRTNIHYVAAIDYAEKHDLTAAVVLHRDGERLIVDRLDVAVPTAGSPVLVAWVEDWITRIAAGFPRVTFVVDEHQLLGTVQRLERRHRLVRFPFAGGKGNHELALLLRRLVVHRQLAWYPDCGARPDAPADTLETELASLVLKESESGRLRFDHPPSGHDDRAFALAAAAWFATTSSTGSTTFKITPPTRGGLLAW